MRVPDKDRADETEAFVPLMIDVGEPPFPPPPVTATEYTFMRPRAGNLFNELSRSVGTVQRTHYLHLQGVQRRVTSQVAHSAGLGEVAVAAEDLLAPTG